LVVLGLDQLEAAAAQAREARAVGQREVGGDHGARRRRVAEVDDAAGVVHRVVLTRLQQVEVSVERRGAEAGVLDGHVHGVGRVVGGDAVVQADLLGPHGQRQVRRIGRQDVVAPADVGGVRDLLALELRVPVEALGLGDAFRAAADHHELGLFVFQAPAHAEELLVVGHELRGRQRERDVAERRLLHQLFGVALVDDRDVPLVLLGVVEVDVDGDLPADLALDADLQFLAHLEVALDLLHVQLLRALGALAAGLLQLQRDELAAGDGQAGFVRQVDRDARRSFRALARRKPARTRGDGHGIDGDLPPRLHALFHRLAGLVPKVLVEVEKLPLGRRFGGRRRGLRQAELLLDGHIGQADLGPGGHVELLHQQGGGERCQDAAGESA
jgi:hypothetical protein